MNYFSEKAYVWYKIEYVDFIVNQNVGKNRDEWYSILL